MKPLYKHYAYLLVTAYFLVLLWLGLEWLIDVTALNLGGYQSLAAAIPSLALVLLLLRSQTFKAYAESYREFLSEAESIRTHIIDFLVFSIVFGAVGMGILMAVTDSFQPESAMSIMEHVAVSTGRFGAFVDSLPYDMGVGFFGAAVLWMYSYLKICGPKKILILFLAFVILILLAAREYVMSGF